MITPNEKSSDRDDRKMGGNSGQRAGDSRSQQGSQQDKKAADTNKAPDAKSGPATSGRGNQRDQNRGSSKR